MNNKYANAYKEVLEILSYFSEEEFNKIPEDKIEYFKNNMNKDYEFKINPSVNLSEQNISKEANAIIVKLYLEYYANDEQKNKIKEILKLNQKKKEIEKKEKYNPDDIFSNANKESKIDSQDNEKMLVEYKESFFVKFKKFIFKLLHVKK